MGSIVLEKCRLGGREQDGLAKVQTRLKNVKNVSLHQVFGGADQVLDAPVRYGRIRNPFSLVWVEVSVLHFCGPILIFLD